MKFLDDRIIFEISNTSITTHDAGTYSYFVRRINAYNDIENIFAGNFYYNGTDTAITFDVSDIIASDCFSINEDDFNGTYSLKNKLVNKYNIRVVWGTGSSNSSDSEWIAKVFNYQNRNLTNSNLLFTPDTGGNYKKATVLLQGFTDYYTRKSKILPHYPLFNDEQTQSENNCPFALSFLVGESVRKLTGSFIVNGEAQHTAVDYQRNFIITSSGNSFSYISRVGKVADYYEITPESDGVLKISDGVYGIKVENERNPDYTFIYVRYELGDRTGSTPYAFAVVNDSYDSEFVEVDYTDIDTNDLIYSASLFPLSGSYLYDADGYESLVLETNLYKSYSYDTAVFDICPKKYYLFWQDRLGSFQCQGFNDFANYSETFTKSEIQDYQNRRRNCNVQVQGKWKIYSGWISEDLYPYYESIYTSQLLILYDSDLNKRFTVLVTGDYEEKTYRNQKKMINMNLELQENKIQNIIY